MAGREQVDHVVSWKPREAKGFTEEEVVSPVSTSDGDK